jgi:hypothetical protein
MTEGCGFVLRKKDTRTGTNRRGFIRIRASRNEEDQSGDDSGRAGLNGRDIDSSS